MSPPDSSVSATAAGSSRPDLGTDDTSLARPSVVCRWRVNGQSERHRPDQGGDLLLAARHRVWLQEPLEHQAVEEGQQKYGHHLRFAVEALGGGSEHGADGLRGRATGVSIVGRQLLAHVLGASGLGDGLDEGDEQWPRRLEHLASGDEQGPQSFERRGILVGEGAPTDLPVPTVEELDHRLVEEGFLGSEVVADRGEVGAGGRGDVAGGRVGVALGLQVLDRPLDELVAVTRLRHGQDPTLNLYIRQYCLRRTEDQRWCEVGPTSARRGLALWLGLRPWLERSLDDLD